MLNLFRYMKRSKNTVKEWMWKGLNPWMARQFQNLLLSNSAEETLKLFDAQQALIHNWGMDTQ